MMSSQKKIDQIKILERVKEAMKVKTDSELANLLNIKQPSLSKWRSRGSIDIIKIMTICQNISLEWLIYGEGTIDGKPKIDNISKKILAIIERMDYDQKIEMLKKAEKEELLNELLKQKKDSEAEKI